LDVAGPEIIDVRRELAKLAAAVRSPGAAVKDEQEPPAREEIRKRADPPLLIWQREARRDGQRRAVHAIKTA